VSLRTKVKEAKRQWGKKIGAVRRRVNLEHSGKRNNMGSILADEKSKGGAIREET